MPRYREAIVVLVLSGPVSVELAAQIGARCVMKLTHDRPMFDAVALACLLLTPWTCA